MKQIMCENEKCNIGNFVLGKTERMIKIFEMIKRIAKTNHSVLISGPTGSGKEVIANLIYTLSDEPDQEFIDVNCAAIPESLIESHFFGHKKGAFTGAECDHKGYFSKVGRGVLFLDEIADLSLLHQSKLLRVLETRSFRAVGSNESIIFKGRIIAACHKDLEQMVKNKTFREDLFYRLNIFHLKIPGLDERREDIPQLVDLFLAKQHRSFTFTSQAMKLLCNAKWPGNIRQLKNTIDKISVLTDENPVSADTVNLYTNVKYKNPGERLMSFAKEVLNLDTENKLSLAEKILIKTAMEYCNGNKSQTARMLGVHRKVIERRLNSFNCQELIYEQISQ